MRRDRYTFCSMLLMAVLFNILLCFYGVRVAYMKLDVSIYSGSVLLNYSTDDRIRHPLTFAVENHDSPYFDPPRLVQGVYAIVFSFPHVIIYGPLLCVLFWRCFRRKCPESICSVCGYDIKTLKICPECGTKIKKCL